MIERYFAQAKVLIRLRSGSVGPHLPRFVSALEQRRFSPDTIRRYIRGADSLCRWLDDQGVAAVEASCAHGMHPCAAICRPFLDCPSGRRSEASRYLLRSISYAALIRMNDRTLVRTDSLRREFSGFFQEDVPQAGFEDEMLEAVSEHRRTRIL
jgi:hypothetical protein